jgi:hypothetical protein
MEVTKINGQRVKAKKADPLNRLIDLTAERATLATMIQQPAEIPGITAEVSSADFHDPSLGLLFKHVAELASNKQLIGRDGDLPLIVSRCKAAGDLEQIGGSAAIVKLLEVPPHHGREHAATVRRLSAMRQLLRTVEEVPSAIIAGCVDEAVELLQSASVSAQAATTGLRTGGIQSAAKLAKQHPDMRPEVIGDLLRQGETMNVIGASKAGKSWLIHGLAVAVANGIPWLGRDVSQGKVLIIDNELHPETLSNRIQAVAAATLTGTDFDDHKRPASTEMIDLLPLRGVSVDFDVYGLYRRLASVPHGTYRMICIDALYRAIPVGTSESDNAQMMQVYNCLDRIAEMTGASLVLNHHATKGDQSGKAVTDVGSGAGSISRATDTHVVIRPHEDDELCVLEAVCRSLAPPQARSIRFEWPTWVQSTAEPKLKPQKNQKQTNQELQDSEGRDLILENIGPDGETANALRDQLGFGLDRVKRLLGQLKRSGQVRAATRPCSQAKEGLATFYFRT